MVRLQNGDGKSIKPSNLEPLSEEARHGRVMAFWGDAQWSRAQLLGEIARGSWGMCRASVAELIAEPRESRRGLDGRLAFAPISEMSDDYIRDAQQQMEALRATAQAAGVSSVRTTAPEDVEEGVADTAGSSGDTGLDNSAGRDEGEEAADETVNECAGGTGAQEVDQGIAEEPGAVYDDEGNRGTHGDGSVGMNLMVDVGEAVETKDSQQHASEAPTASAA